MRLKGRHGATCLVILAGLSMTACGGGVSTVSPPPPQKSTPTVTVTPAAPGITTVQSLQVTVAVSGTSSTPTGSVTLSSGNFTSSAAALTAGSASITIPAGSLAASTDTLTASYTPDAASSSTYNGASGAGQVTVNKVTPTVTVLPASPSITTTQGDTVTVTVSGGANTPAATGSVTLASGSYTSAATAMTNGSAQIVIPAGALAVGNPELTANYTPDATSSSIYAGATGTGSVTVSSLASYTLAVDSAAPSSGITITVSPADNNSKGSGTTPFTRTYNAGTQVTLSAALSDGSYSFVSWSGCTSNPVASNCVATVNANQTVTATYNESTVNSITVSPNTATIGSQQQFTATVNGTGSYSSGVTWSLTCTSCGSLSPGTLSASGLYTTPYPAPASVTVTATSTMTGFTNVSGSTTVALNPPATASGPTLIVDVNTPNTPSESPHNISPYVYGMNGYFLDSASARIASPGIVRWGGDDISRYNYQTTWTNAASDWYFENSQGAGSMFPYNGANSGTFDGFLDANNSVGSASLGTVPVNGWVSNSQNACSFPQSSFPDQIGQNGYAAFTSYNGEQCGYGAYAEGSGGCTSAGGCSIYGSSTIAAITSQPEPPPDITSSSTPAPGSVTAAWADGTWPGGWVSSLVNNAKYGGASGGKGVAVWDLDNEPTWWSAVHRDVHPNPFTYDEVTNHAIGTALAIKTADPSALVSGPVIDYWWAYFYSMQDIWNGWDTGPCNEPWSGPTDRAAHGGVPLIEYFLQEFAKYSGPSYYNTRLLDYVDIHGYFAPDYPAGSDSSVAFTTAGDTQEQQARMNGTRVFWDPTYTDPNFPQPNYITDSNYTTSCSPPAQAPQLIPMLQKWVANDYPGTKTGIDEYNFGGLESINGALVQADILGIFGRQGLGMSALWPSEQYSAQGPGNYAFAMYRNYDLANDGAMFGDVYLYASSSASGADAEGKLAVYGGQRSADKAITIIVINKTYGPLTSTISLENFTAASGTTALVYRYSNANLGAIVQQAGVSVTPPSGSGTTSTIGNYTFPAQSITLFVVPN